MSTVYYRIGYCMALPIFGTLLPCRHYGKENIPEGAAIVCANHSNAIDPVLIGFAFGRKRQLFIMAKAELFKVPIVAAAFKAVGAFPVSRGETDINSVRTAMKHLKNGEKILMFPEGTRVGKADSVAAKNGAVRIATKLDVPILPIFLSDDKRYFRWSKIIIGEPFKLQVPADKNYSALSEELMERIHALRDKY